MCGVINSASWPEISKGPVQSGTVLLCQWHQFRADSCSRLIQLFVIIQPFAIIDPIQTVSCTNHIAINCTPSSLWCHEGGIYNNNLNPKEVKLYQACKYSALLQVPVPFQWCANGWNMELFSDASPSNSCWPSPKSICVHEFPLDTLHSYIHKFTC